MANEYLGDMETKLLSMLLALKTRCTMTDDRIRGETRLSPAEYRALHSIKSGETVSSAEFAERMDLSPSRGSRVIDQLIKNGYCSRTASADDRRVVFIALTLQGRWVKERVEAITRECEGEIRNKLTEEEMTRVYEGINLLLKALDPTWKKD